MGMEKLIEKFIDNDCHACYGNQFAYLPDEEIIVFTCEEPIETNVEWKKFLKNTFDFNLTAENVFTMSILHELGHHYTVGYFSDEDWESQALEKGLEDLEGAELMQAYYNLPIEKIATEFAVKVYNENPKEMRIWNHRFNCAIRHFEKKYDVKNSLLTKF